MQGNTVYAQKSGYDAFAKSMLCYDSAFQIAQKSQDTLLMAASYYALGRAYDAWNKDPQKTIAYYTLAADYYEVLPEKLYRAFFLKHLVAHAYDKVQDSANTIKTLTALYNKIITLPDSTKKTLDFTTEMALISSEVKNYTLTQQILNNLTTRATIINNDESYDFLNHYYLTKARLAVYADKATASPYLDSLEYVLKTAKNISDSNYFAENLKKLFSAAHNEKKIQYYNELARNTFDKLNAPAGVVNMQKTINQIENGAIEKEIALKKQQINTRNIFGAVLLGLLIIISALTLFLYKRGKEIKKRRNQLYATNKELGIKNQQNELLNKEIHHRVKNNLQIILSLVYMQERNTETEEVKDNMQSIRLRIESISNLHQQLMEQTGAIDLNRYVQLLVTNVSNLLGDEKKIINHLQIQSLQVSQKISFPLGLIINEWITNSVKYAKPQGDCLELFITIHTGNDAITVKYNDNGITQTSRPVKKSLGLDIVNLLTGQLNATLTLAPTNIFDYSLQIPLTDGE
jgi:two-component sensor histidine kinase